MLSNKMVIRDCYFNLIPEGADYKFPVRLSKKIPVSQKLMFCVWFNKQNEYFSKIKNIVTMIKTPGEPYCLISPTREYCPTNVIDDDLFIIPTHDSNVATKGQWLVFDEGDVSKKLDIYIVLSKSDKILTLPKIVKRMGDFLNANEFSDIIDCGERVFYTSFLLTERHDIEYNFENNDYFLGLT